MFVNLYEVAGPLEGERRKRRVFLGFVGTARGFGSAAMLAAMAAVALAWWRPSAPASPVVIALGQVAFGCAVVWVLVLFAARWWLRVTVMDRRERRGWGSRRWGSVRRRRTRPRGPSPSHWPGGEDWWPAVTVLVLLFSFLGVSALALALASVDDPGAAERLRWWVTLPLLGLGGGVGGIVAWACVTGREQSHVACWSPWGALWRVTVYTLPALLAAPFLIGDRHPWTAAFSDGNEQMPGFLAGLAGLWLIIAPMVHHERSAPGGGGGD
ncbi:hypothetical protein AB0C77_09495 [Streptomyces sp. NPDC048629]|uniref:hypothetical protein n=1 Tax=Streptomyces sp. NPDC048629 TaxID=3154824 RepID=UPI00342989DD